MFSLEVRSPRWSLVVLFAAIINQQQRKQGNSLDRSQKQNHLVRDIFFST